MECSCADVSATMVAVISLDRAPIVTDAEITSLADDSLGRDRFARRVAERIVTAGGGPSVVFGLAGPWGSGKTSAINMIREVLREEHSKDWSVVRFTPWSTADVASLTDEFYQSIAAAMPTSKKGRKAAQHVMSMAPAVTAAVGKAGMQIIIDKYVGDGAAEKLATAASDSIAGKLGEFTVEPNPFVERFAKAANAIKSAGQNVLVVVDDVDRLHTDELLTVLKAVRLLGRFDRVHYMLSYDEQTLLDVLQESDIARGDRIRASAYLEKIIQYPYVLPPLQRAHIVTALLQSLTGIAKVHKARGKARAGGRDPVETVIKQIPFSWMRAQRLTLRSVYRLASQSDVLLTMAGGCGEVDFVDAVLITYLRLHHRTVYDRLPLWRDDLVYGSRMRQRLGVDSEPINWPERIKDVLGEHPDPLDVASLMQILGELFPLTTEQDDPVRSTPLSVGHPDYFDRYFLFGIPVEDVADSTIRTELMGLFENGYLPTRSAVRDALQYGSGLRLMARKMEANTDVMDALTAFPAAVHTAFHLSRLIITHEHWMSPDAEKLLCIFAQHVVLCAPSVAAAREFADEYADEIGALVATDVFDMHGIIDEKDIDRDRLELLKAAREAVRDRVTQACIEDLSAVVETQDTNTITIVRAMTSLLGYQWDLLAKKADRLIAAGTLPWELAGRFVTVGDSPETSTLHADYFSLVVPPDRWQSNNITDADQIAAPGGSAAVASLRERIAFAATVMKTSSAGEEHI